jgi:uncharacterized membrane protein
MKSGRTDLAATAALAVVSALVVIGVPGAHLLRTMFAVLLVVVLPGYSLTAALFAGLRIDWPRRVLLTFGLGLSVSIVVALVLNLFPSGLRSWTWALALLIATCSGCAIAAARRRRRGPVNPAVPTFSFPRVRLRDLCVALVALVVFGGAVAFARTPLAAKNAQGYSAVWLLPGAGGTTTRVRVGVTSAEQQARSYRLVLRIGSKIVYRRKLALAPGGNFATVVKLGGRQPRGAKLVASLYLRDRPNSIYRLARLSLSRAKTP